MLHDGAISFIRTYVPVIVGSVVSWLLVTFGLELTPEHEAGLIAGLTGLLVGVYYAIARFLESKVHPFFGVLLGSKKKPHYAEPAKPVEVPADEDGDHRGEYLGA